MLITKKNSIVASIVCLLLFNHCKTPNEATVLLEKSINAHGGKALWENVSAIRYNKKTVFYFEDGTVEKVVDQQHFNRFNPFYASQQWASETGTYFATMASEELQLTLDNQPINNAEEIAAAQNSIQGAFYVFWQPYKLLDPDTQLEYLGPKKLFTNQQTVVLKATYPMTDSTDIWYYFLDQQNYRVVASAVDHDGRISLITNDAYEEKTGLFLNQKRSSYFVDQNFVPRYLRASYDYQIVSIDWKLANPEP